MRTRPSYHALFRSLSLTALMLLCVAVVAGCNGSDGSDGSDGPRGLPLLVESTDITTDTCWGSAELRVYGYDTSEDGAVDDIVLEETICDREAPDQQLYGRNVLYYQDSEVDPQFRESLQQLAAGGAFELLHTTSASESLDWLEGERIDIVFAMVQHSTITGALADALADWVADGGRLIFTTWQTTDTVMPTALEAEFTGSSNLEAATFESQYLGWQLPSPAAISNTPNEWITFSNGLRAVDKGISVCTWENDESCAVVGNEGRTLMLGFLFTTLDEEYFRQFAVNALAYVLSDDLDGFEQWKP